MAMPTDVRSSGTVPDGRRILDRSTLGLASAHRLLDEHGDADRDPPYRCSRSRETLFLCRWLDEGTHHRSGAGRNGTKSARVTDVVQQADRSRCYDVHERRVDPLAR